MNLVGHTIKICEARRASQEDIIRMLIALNEHCSVPILGFYIVFTLLLSV